ncbi:MAG TPA: hypothetical protein VIJ39_12520 [Solirubrobacteraceae bacterium]
MSLSRARAQQACRNGEGVEAVDPGFEGRANDGWRRGPRERGRGSLGPMGTPISNPNPSGPPSSECSIPCGRGAEDHVIAEMIFRFDLKQVQLVG